MNISVIMPCLNEAETVVTCIRKAQNALKTLNLESEIIVADNGSTDGSQEKAKSAGAKVVNVETRGYGGAILGGINSASGTYIIIGDADDSYDFSQIPEFIKKLRIGYDLVMGNRFQGEIKKGAMPFLHHYLGNPVLSFFGRLLFRKPYCRDFHCGLRGFRKDAIKSLDLRTTGMEFATEMVAKSALHGLKITEIPTTLSPDGRTRPPHLRSWQDGWRHLRFMFLYSPTWLFLIPGILLILIGTLIGGWLLTGEKTFAGVTFDIHTLLFCGVAVVIGFQGVIFHFFSKVFAINEGLLPKDRIIEKLAGFLRLEIGILVGVIFFTCGICTSLYAVLFWGKSSFGQLNPVEVMRFVIPAAVLIMLGCQIILSSFFLSILSLNRK